MAVFSPGAVCLFVFLPLNKLNFGNFADFCLTPLLGVTGLRQGLERFSYDLEMKTCEQNRNNKRTEIERFDWFIERIQACVAFGWLSERSGEKTSIPRIQKEIT